jgi:hypothetical protein
MAKWPVSTIVKKDTIARSRKAWKVDVSAAAEQSLKKPRLLYVQQLIKAF